MRPNWNNFAPKGQQYVCCKNMVEHGGGPVLLWGCIGENLDCMKNIIASLKYQVILAKILIISNDHQASVCAPKTSQSTRPNLIKFGLGISRRIFLQIYRFKSHWKYLL